MMKNDDLKRLLRYQESFMEAYFPRKPTCGARTRHGAACQSRVLRRGGRCKNHGGLCTGPKTPEGKAKSALNGVSTRFGSSRR